MAAVVMAVPAGGTADMGPPVGRQSQDRDVIVVDCFGGTAWKAAEAPSYQAVRVILSGQAPDPAALRRIDPELAPFYCPDCAQNYCRADWRTCVLFDDGSCDCTIGRCPNGHEHMSDDCTKPQAGKGGAPRYTLGPPAQPGARHPRRPAWQGRTGFPRVFRSDGTGSAGCGSDRAPA